MIALLLLTLWQYLALGVNGPVPLDAGADTMTDALRFGKLAQREDLLRRLGIQAAAVQEAAKENGLEVETIEGTGANLLFVPCDSSSREAHLYLLRQQKGGWHAVDDAELSCWRRPSSYEFVRVPGRPGMLVLAHHANATHGTGLVRDEMKLLQVRGDRWATVLTTTEYKSEDVTGEGLTVERAATLQPFPDGSLEETRATTRHEGSRSGCVCKSNGGVGAGTPERKTSPRGHSAPSGNGCSSLRQTEGLRGKGAVVSLRRRRQLLLPAPPVTVARPLLTEPENLREQDSQAENQTHKRPIVVLEVKLQLHFHPTLQSSSPLRGVSESGGVRLFLTEKPRRAQRFRSSVGGELLQ